MTSPAPSNLVPVNGPDARKERSLKPHAFGDEAGDGGI